MAAHKSKRRRLDSNYQFSDSISTVLGSPVDTKALSEDHVQLFKNSSSDNSRYKNMNAQHQRKTVVEPNNVSRVTKHAEIHRYGYPWMSRSHTNADEVPGEREVPVAFLSMSSHKRNHIADNRGIAADEEEDAVNDRDDAMDETDEKLDCRSTPISSTDSTSSTEALNDQCKQSSSHKLQIYNIFLDKPLIEEEGLVDADTPIEHILYHYPNHFTDFSVALRLKGNRAWSNRRIAERLSKHNSIYSNLPKEKKFAALKKWAKNRRGCGTQHERQARKRIR